MNEALAGLATLLVLASLFCMVRGVRAIRRHDELRHRRFMLTAFALQASFVPVFLTRILLFGMIPFAYEDASIPGALYLGLLVSHEAIAVVTVPLVLTTIAFGLAGKVLEHREVARVSFPAWVYASATGVLVFSLLYLLPLLP